jgi:hypothetical protein
VQAICKNRLQIWIKHRAFSGIAVLICTSDGPIRIANVHCATHFRNPLSAHKKAQTQTEATLASSLPRNEGWADAVGLTQMTKGTHKKVYLYIVPNFLKSYPSWTMNHTFRKFASFLLLCLGMIIGTAMHPKPTNPDYYVLGNSGGVYKNNVKIDSGYEGLSMTAVGKDYYILGNGGGVYKNNVKIASGYEGVDIAADATGWYVLGQSGGVYKNDQKIDSDYEGLAIDAYGGHYYVLTVNGNVYKDGQKIDSGYEAIDIAADATGYYVLGKSGGVYHNNQKIDDGYDAVAIDAAGGHYFILGTSGGVYRDNVKIDSGYEAHDIAVAAE